MSRISVKTRGDLPVELRPLWDKMTTYGAFENQAGVMAHRPPIFEHIWSMLIGLADEAVLSKRYLELALVTVSLLNKCSYCVSHHAPKLAIQGVSEEGAERLL
ncbi:MAG: carboxymuconolactone decarboxylase family protein, partial [Bradyrhizobium sp.]